MVKFSSCVVVALDAAVVLDGCGGVLTKRSSRAFVEDNAIQEAQLSGVSFAKALLAASVTFLLLSCRQ